MANDTRCPGCNGDRTVLGTVADSGVLVRRLRFKPDAVAGRFFWFSCPEIAVPGRSFVCLDCGLLWSIVDPDTANRMFVKFVHGID